MKQSVASCSEYCFSPSYKLHKTQIESSRPIPLVDAFPLDIWLYKEPEELQGSATGPSPAKADKKTPSCDDQQEQQRAKMHLLVQIETIVNVQINHYQLLFLMRFLETLGEITCFLTQVIVRTVYPWNDREVSGHLSQRISPSGVSAQIFKFLQNRILEKTSF